MRRVLLAFGLAVASAALLVAQPPAAESPAAVAAKKRQEAIKSLEVKFHIKETIEPGSQSASRVSNPRDKGFPDKQLVLESDNRLVLDGSSARLEMNHPMADLRTQRWTPTKQVAVHHGNEAKRYYAPTEVEVTRENSVASIKSPAAAKVTHGYGLLLLMLNARGADAALCPWSFAEGKWQLDGSPFSQGGATYQQLRYRSPEIPSSASLTCWVDTKRDFAVKRVRLEIPKGEGTLLDATLETDPDSKIVYPRAWTWTTFDPSGKVQSTLTSTVTAIRFNPTVAPSELELVFPPNVEVVNQIDGNSYLVRADGSFQKLSAMGADSEAIRAEAASSWWARNWLWLAGALVVASLLGWLARSRSVRGKLPATSQPTP